MSGLLLLASLAGSALIGWSAILLARFTHPRAVMDRAGDVTLLKPLHGAEPNLAANLATFLDQGHHGEIRMLCGVQRENDPAIAIVKALQVEWPEIAIELIVDGRRHGSNAKVSNLINLLDRRAHDEILILSDSDMAVGKDYLARILDVLDQPGVGAVTCLYRGRGDSGLWSRLVALGIDLHFLPSVVIGLATGLGKPCMGSTIALRRETLDRIGGFAILADTLADDYALGAAVRALGLKVVVPNMLITHACKEARFSDLSRQELRWNATVSGIDPAGYAGSIVLHPLPLALLGGLLGGFTPLAWMAVVLALAARGLIALRLHHGARDIMLIPVRDLLSFLLFIPGFFARSVDWRGTRLVRTAHGKISADTETSE